MLIAAWLIAMQQPPHLSAQYLSEPQASTQEEYDQYLQLAVLTDPTKTIASAESFSKAFPDSAMLPKVYRVELDAWKAMGDARMAIAVGEKILQLVPDNLDVMAEVAYLIADTETDAADLKKAKVYGIRTLESLDTLQIPRAISPEKWGNIRNALEVKAHSALGLVAFKSDLLNEAITEFELALQSSGGDDAALLYRLGTTYRLAGLQEKAREVLRRAADAGDPNIRQRAEQELRQSPP